MLTYFGATVCKAVRRMLSDSFLLSVCPACDIGVLCPNGWMDEDETWRGGRSRPRPHCVRWEPSAAILKKGAQSLQFSAHVCCGRMAIATVKLRNCNVI